jgi:hypothetical protein
MRNCMASEPAARAKSRTERCCRKRRVKRQVRGSHAALKRKGKRLSAERTKPPRAKERPPMQAAARVVPRERRSAYVPKAAR